jgi:hypothetical protein
MVAARLALSRPGCAEGRPGGECAEQCATSWAIR